MALRPFRALAAPIDASTGDRRRFAEGSLTTQPLPMPGRWQRADAGGHDDAVSVASITGVEFDGEEIWLTGHMFTDALERGLPRLAEDVAEAIYLAEQGVLGFSVDLDDFIAEPVRVGSSDPLTAEDLDDEDLEVELLVTKGRMRAATMVAIPAYVETNHTIQFQDLDDEAEAEPDDPAETDPEMSAVADTEPTPVAVTAAAGPVIHSIDKFTAPVPITGPTPMVYDFERGIAYGHIAPWGVCHVGRKDVCLTAPEGGEGRYRDFHTHRVETDEGTVYAGRITVGGDHAPEDPDLSVHGVRAFYDQKTVVAHVRIVDDEWGAFACGPLEVTDPHLVPRIRRAVTSGQIREEHAVSGDWRETVDGLSLIEVLALSPGRGPQSEPGFPIPIRVSFRGERQMCLTASLMPATLLDMPEAAEVFRETAARLVREELARAKTADDLRGKLSARLGREAAERREQLVRMMGA